MVEYDDLLIPTYDSAFTHTAGVFPYIVLFAVQAGWENCHRISQLIVKF